MSNIEELSKVLRDKTMLVLEDMCFMFPEDDTTTEYPPQAQVTVPFTGDVSGVLRIIAYGETLSEIALNMSGEEEMEGDRKFDALGEFGNVLCGNILPFVAEGVHFTIQQPEVAPCTETPPKDPVCPLADFVFINGMIRVTLCLDK